MSYRDLKHSYVVSRLKYDPETGIFTWIKPLSNVRQPGDRAGTPQRNGNRTISIDKRPVLESQLAWFYITGEWSEFDIEHINGQPADNRWSNLREAKPKAMGGPLTVERIREVLRYDAETGVFTWRCDMRAGRGYGRPLVKAGSIAGCLKPNGYVAISIDAKRYQAHRLAWVYTHGHWPVANVDHVNGDPSDNRLCNLRAATQAQNCCNSRKPRHNSSGYKGVSYDPRRGMYEAYISLGNRKKGLGRFASAEDAHRAYCEAAEKHRGEFARFE